MDLARYIYLAHSVMVATEQPKKHVWNYKLSKTPRLAQEGAAANIAEPK